MSVNASVVIDALLAAVLLLALPVGFARGVVRGVFTAAGILTGAAIGASWGERWSLRLADLSGLGVATARFAVVAGTLLGAVFVIGSLAPMAARVPRPGLAGRCAGVPVAGANAAVGLGILLTAVKRDLAGDRLRDWLAESRLAGVLVDRAAWVLLGYAGLAVLLTLGGLLLSRRPQRLPAATPATVWGAPAAPARRRRRLPAGPDEGKVEPAERGYDPQLGRYAADAPHFAETMPIAPVAGVTWSDRPAPPEWRTTGAEWVEVARPAGWTAVASRCPGCGEALDPAERFCPRCGRARD